MDPVVLPAIRQLPLVHYPTCLRRGGRAGCCGAPLHKDGLLQLENREMQFPDPVVIIPCSVECLNQAHRVGAHKEASPREFGRQKSVKESAKFPVNFPVSREFDPENGSHQTQSTAKDYSLRGIRQSFAPAFLSTVPGSPLSR